MSKQKRGKGNDHIVEPRQCCTCCGQLYSEITAKRPWWRSKKKHVAKEERGKCLVCREQCNPKKLDSDQIFAIASCASIFSSPVKTEEDYIVVTETSSSSSFDSDVPCCEVITNIPQNAQDVVFPMCSKSRHKESKGDKFVYFGNHNQNGQRNGHGDMVWSNGDRYVGQFFNGKCHGQGRLYFKDGSYYDGEWECNQMHGQGKRCYVNGDIYIGTYVNGKRSTNVYDINEMATFYFANGDMYKGHLLNDEIHGYGRFEYFQRSGIVSFEGIYKHGKRHGLGKLERQDGVVDVCYYNCGEKTFPIVRWSPDRKLAWKILKDTNGTGKVFKTPISPKVAIEEGYDCLAFNRIKSPYHHVGNTYYGGNILADVQPLTFRGNE